MIVLALCFLCFTVCNCLDEVLIEFRIRSVTGTMEDEGCDLSSDFKQQLDGLQKILKTKARLGISFKFQDDLIKQRNKEGTLKSGEVEVIVKVDKKEAAKSYFLSGCDIEKEILRILSEFLTEDLEYFTSDHAASCSLEDLWQGMPNEAADHKFSLDEIYAGNLFHLSEHVFREFIDNTEQGKPVFVAFWNEDESPQEILGILELIMSTDSTFKIGLIHCKYLRTVCRDEDVTSTPRLHAYIQSKIYKIYEGPLTVTHISNWMKMLHEPVLYKVTEQTAAYFRSGIIPNSAFENDRRQAVTVGFFANKEIPEYKDFEKVAKLLHGKYHLGVMVNADIAKWAHNPALITFKDAEMFEKAETLYEGMDFDGMKKFTEISSRPYVDILDIESPPPGIGTKNLVMFIDAPQNDMNDPSEQLQQFHLLATNKTARDKFSFAYIQASPENSLASRITESWLIRKALLPAIILFDPKKCSLYLKYPKDGMSSERLLKWLDNNFENDAIPHLVLGEKSKETAAGESPKKASQKTEL